MKYLSVILFLSLITINKLPAQKTNHALIFAIGDYPATGGWAKLASANDAKHVKSALLRQGFDSSNIETILDEKVTVKGVTDVINRLVNNSKLKSGDVVLIHFSTHGEQIKDDNEDETDDYDESVVTYNAKAPDRNGHSEDFNKHQADYLRDDQLASLINKLRVKLGKNGDLVVVMDLCHSGSGTRGRGRVRGGMPALVPSSSGTGKKAIKDTTGIFREKSKTNEDESALATYVVFSAAKAEELDYETTDDDSREVGPLSYAISKVLYKLDPSTTYRSIFSKIQSVMNEKVPGQHPVMEGNGIDRAFWGGNFIAQKPYVEIEAAEGKEIRINAGLFAGLDSGARVMLYNSGTNDPRTAIPLDSGKVIKAGMYKATARLSKDFGGRQPASVWVFVTEPAYNTKPVNVSIEPASTGRGIPLSEGFPQSVANKIKDDLKALPLFQFNGEPELLLVKGRGEIDSIKIATNGYLYGTFKNDTSNQLLEKLQNYAQYRFLQGLEIKEPDVYVEVRLVPYINGKADTAKVKFLAVNAVPQYNKGIEFDNGDKFVLWVKNPGAERVFFNILDLQPDGLINPVLPNRKQNIYADDLKIEAGASRLFDKYIITVAPPYGTEIFKVFASTEVIDLEIIATSRGGKARSNFGVLERLVKKSYDSATRGVDANNIGGANGSCYNLPFIIKAK